MLNIIKADMYRIFRSKGFYITIGLLLLLIGLQVLANDVGRIMVVGDVDKYNDVVSDKVFTGKIAPLAMIGTADTLLYFMIPFMIFIGSADFSSGTAKNVLSNGMPRIKYYLAKLFLSCVFCVFILMMNIILPIIVGTVKNGFGGAFDMEFVGQLSRPFLAQLFMCLAVTCVGIFLVFVTKRTAAVIGAYIAFCMVPMLILSIFAMINNKLEFLLKYDVVSNIRLLAGIDMLPSADATRAFAVGAFYIIASTIGGILIFRKSEIK